jgi:hypothetical protein
MTICCSAPAAVRRRKCPPQSSATKEVTARMIELEILKTFQSKKERHAGVTQHKGVKRRLK